jgi:hypothetical protein
LALPARLVVDQLVAAVGQLVDAVDPPAQQVRPELERERALEPHRLVLARGVQLPVAVEGLDGPLSELALIVGVAEAGPAPGRLEQVH